MRPISIIRSAGIIGVLALFGAMLMPTAAQAAPGDTVIVFSNSDVVDTSNGVDGGEYEWISDAITAAGYNVVPFDGGDGQASTWTTELSGVNYFVLPEQEIGPFYDPDSPPSWLSTAAWDVLINWIKAGGNLIVSGSCDPDQSSTVQILNAATGVNYDGVLGDCIETDTSTRWIDDSSLADEIGWVDGTYGIPIVAFSPQQLAKLTVWYTAPACTFETLTAGVFAAGDGRVSFEAWDYFNDEDHPADQSKWNQVLVQLIEGNSADSNWTPNSFAKTPITAKTATGEELYTIAEIGCGANYLNRVDPGTGAAAPVGENIFELGIPDTGYQGATDPTTGISYLPVSGSEPPALYTVNTANGVFSKVGDFSSDMDYLGPVQSLAIGSSGAAFAFAPAWNGDDPFLGLFSLDLSDASLTLIAEMDLGDVDDAAAFAYNPADGKFYVFDEENRTFFQVNVQTGALTYLGELDGPSVEEFTYVTALQVDRAGTFWVSYDVPASIVGGDPDDWVSMLATFALSDVSAGTVQAHEVGVLVDDPLFTYSLLLSGARPELAATGIDGVAASGIGFGGGVALLLGLGLIVVRRRVRLRKSA